MLFISSRIDRYVEYAGLPTNQSNPLFSLNLEGGKGKERPPNGEQRILARWMEDRSQGLLTHRGSLILYEESRLQCAIVFEFVFVFAFAVKLVRVSRTG